MLRAAFGDHEHPAYTKALESYCEQGLPAGQQECFMSAYAAMHPWEDFADCGAFYLAVSGPSRHRTPLGFAGEQCTQREPGSWLSRQRDQPERGLKDLIPEVVTPGIQRKLEYIDRLVRESASRQ